MISALPFVGIDQLDGRSHIMLDGMARPGTVLTLSHWPMAHAPAALERDLSAEIAFAYLDADEPVGGAVAISCDHFDKDGLASSFTLANPEFAIAHKNQIVEFARIGDFGVVRDDLVVQSALAIDVLSDRDRSPIDFGTEELVGNAWTTKCFETFLPLFPELLTDPTQYRDLYEEDLQQFNASTQALASGECTIEEVPALSLAIVRCDGDLSVKRYPYGHGSSLPLHEWAINSATEQPRVLVLELDRACYYDRYETWVRYVSKKLALRRDLEPLASQLNAAELGNATWTAGSPGSLFPTLSIETGNSSTISSARLIELMTRYLEKAPSAWDPFNGRHPLVTQD